MIKNLTQGNPLKILILFALPMLLGNVFQQLYNLTDSIIVGQFVGADALAAVGSTFPITFLITGIASGASVGCSIIISKDFGAQSKRIKSSIYSSIILVSIIGLIVMITLLIFLEPFLKFLGTPTEIFEHTYSYCRIVMFGCYFMFLYNCLTSIYNALGDSKTPLKFLIISTLINIVLDIVLITQFNLKTNGAAIATLITQFIAMCGLLLSFVRTLPKFNFQKVERVFEGKIAREMIYIAIPSIIQQAIISIGMITVQSIVNSYGKEFIAGYSAATKIDAIAIMPMFSVSIALSTFTAQNFGAKQIKRVYDGFKSSLLLVFLLAFTSTLLLTIFGSYFIKFFVSAEDVSVIAYGTSYFNTVSFFYLILGTMFVINGTLRGVGKMTVFMVSSFINIFMRIFLAFILQPHLGYAAIFWALPIGWLFSGLFSAIYFISGKWKKPLYK